MRVVFLAVDDEFAGEMQRYVYATCPDCIVGSVISSSEIYKKSKLGGIIFVYKRSGLRFLLEMVRMKILIGFFDRRRRYYPAQLAKQHGVEIFVSSNINDEQSKKKLRGWKPDFIISTNFSHYIGKTVREEIPRIGCWNLHKSLLPKFRGMAPNFHALLKGAKTAGATLHVVDKGFDDGDLLTQTEVSIVQSDSIYSLNLKSSESGGKMLASVLKNYEKNPIKRKKQPKGNWINYTYPTRAEVKAFRKKGLKFYAPKES